MDPVEITSISGVVVTVLTSLIVPWVLRHRQTNRATAATEVVSWQGITSVLQKERDLLRKELDQTEADCKAKVAALKEEHSKQLATARARISQLESDLAELYSRQRRMSAD